MAELDWRGEEVEKTIKKAARVALVAATEHLLDEAVQRTPVETGTLRNSAKASYDDDTGMVSYNTPYAARQHEEVGWSHQDGQAKYLETALLDSQAKIQQIIAQEVKKAL